MEFFISDLHFGHKNVIKFDNRPFSSVDEMDQELIRKWNKTVLNTNKDLVYILGDISWYNGEKTRLILEQLNGKKILIKGNHDKNKDIEFYKDLFEEIVDYKEINRNKTKIILSHYPILFYNGNLKNNIMLYGHLHNTEQEILLQDIIKTIKLKGQKVRMYNVGCMFWDYKPISLEQILKFKDK